MPTYLSLSVLIAYNALNCLGGVELASPLTYVVYPWSVHCKRSLMQN